VTLDVTAGADRIKVWRLLPGGSAASREDVSLPASYENPSQLPQTLYVEGIQPSASERDVTLELTYTKNNLTCRDLVKLTVVDARILDPTNPSWAKDTDSDDVLLVGYLGSDKPTKGAKIVYNILPTDLSVQSKKITIKGR